MAWKKAVVMIAIVCGGAFARVAALGTNGSEEQGCWSEYADEAVAIAQNFESCMRVLSRFGSLGSEFCALLYVQEAEWAMADFIGCVFGSAFGIIG